MIKRLILSALMVFLALLIPDTVLAADPSPPTQAFVHYMNTGKLVVMLLTFLSLLIINTKILSHLIKDLKVKTTLRKQIVFATFVTLLSNGVNFFSYSLLLPDANAPAFFGANSMIGGIISGGLSQIAILILLFFFVLNPLYLLSYFFSYKLSTYLLKNYLKVTLAKEKLASKISLAFLPLLGFLLALCFSELYFCLSPLLGNKY